MTHNVVYSNDYIIHSGDIMSFPNLDHLLRLPSGCGEQNLVKTSINYVVAKYLSSIRRSCCY